MTRVMPVLRRLILLAPALALALTLVPVHAADAGDKGRQQAMINLLVRAGKSEEAAAAMRALYPDGPPLGGELALEYYDVVGNTDKGWEEARAGLEKLAKAAPEDVGYRLALARNLARRAATRRGGLQMFADLARQPDIKQRVLEEWRRALGGLDNSSDNINLYQDYLKADPGNTSMLDALAGAQRAEAKRLPWQMRDKADAQLAAGHPEEAAAILRKALQLDPNNAWVRFDLSRLYHKQGDEKQGRALMEEGMSAAPGDADMLYANALYASLLDETESALRLLEKIPASQRSPAMRRLQQKLAIQAAQASARKNHRADAQAAMETADAEQSGQVRDEADAQLAAGHPEEATTILRKALQLDPNNAWVRFDLSRLYHKQGNQAQGRALMEEGISAAPGDADMLYANALYASLLDETESALRLLEKIPASQRSPAMRRLQQKLAIQEQVRQAEAYASAGKRTDTQAAMGRAETDAGSDADLVNIVANAWFDLNDPARGVALMQRLAAQPSPPKDASLYYAKLLNRAERDDDLAAVLEKLSAAGGLTDSDREDLYYLKVSLAARSADNLRHAGNFAAAKAVLAAALGQYPENTDMLMALARVHIAAHEPQQARDIYQLILDHTQREVGVRLAQTGNIALKFDFGIFAPVDVGMRLALAQAMGEAGDKAAAQREMAIVLANTPADDLDSRMAIAGFYIGMGDFDAARNELEVIAGTQNLSPSEAETLAELRESVAMHIADAQTSEGNPALAHKTLAPFLTARPDQVRLLLADARAYRAERQWASAQANYAHVLQLDKTNRDARDGLIESLIAMRNRAAALQRLGKWVADSMPNDPSTRLHLGGLFIDLEEYARAGELITPLLAAYPNHPRALAYAAKIAQHAGRPDDEIDYLKRSLAAEQAERNLSDPSRVPAQTIAYENIGIDEFGSPKRIERDWQEKKLAELIDRRSRWVSSAIDIHSRSGTHGMSLYDSVEIPMEYKTLWHQNDEVFFRVDEVKLNAGYVDPTNTSFGSQLLCQPYCSPALSQQAWAGQSLTAGYEQNNLQADIGVTPLNFPVSNIVGGIHHDGGLGKLSYSIEASRRPVTASLLSFAGTQDPRTGVVWGGVVATGGRLGLSLDEGKTFGFWSSAGLHSLTGRNVLSNGRLQLMAGGQWRVINEENRLFSLGLTGMYWHHTQNAGEYTFGHGGYYSPQNYRSLSLPITYSERYPRFSYVVRGAVSASWSQTQAADYFPTDSAMQAKAITLAPTNFITPMYSGGSSSGTGFSLKGAWEYQVEPKLFAGGLLSIDRSDSYAPNRVLFYLRYSLDHPGAQPVFMPPEPVEPSSQR